MSAAREIVGRRGIGRAAVDSTGEEILMRLDGRLWGAATAAIQAGVAPAGVIEFSHRDAWFAAVDQVTTIDFTDFRPRT